MTFLNAILLGGLLAGAIPIIIHIINRNRFRTLHWGATHLLEEILRTQRRRLRIEQLILLLVRVAIPMLLAFCMARPVLTGAESLIGRARTSLVILFDDSYSMNACPTTQSQFAQAKRHVDQIVDSLPRGSEVSVVWMSTAGSRVGPTFDMARIRGAFSTRLRGFGAADPGASLEAAAALITRAHHVDRELLVVSDFQKNNWSDATAAARQRSLELIHSHDLPPRITLLRVGRQVDDNVAVDSVVLSRAVVGLGRQARIRANLTNYGSARYEDMRVHFRVNGQNRSASQVSLAPGQSGQVVFTHSFDKAGSNVVEVFADADSLQADNVARSSVLVWDRLPVLLVSGDIRSEPLESETAFLEIALQPFAAAATSLADLVQTKLIRPEQLSATELLEHRVVVLANVPVLGDGQVQALAEFVRLGGGMLVFGGDRLNADWYNATLATAGQGLLPCRWADAVHADVDASSARVVAQHFQHPALEFFNDPRNGSVSGFRIRSWFRLRPDGGDAETTSVLAHLDTQDPFLVEKSLDQGRVIQCCTACDDDWSNLPARPSYLPLIQQLVTYLASKVHPPRNVRTGQQLAAVLSPDDAGKTFVLTDPQGKRHELQAVAGGNHSLVEFAATERPGLYVLETADDRTIHFVVQAPREESDLTLLDDDEFAQLAEQTGASAVASADEYLRLDRTRRFGREIFKPILTAVLILLAIEMLLQQRFGRASA